MGATQTAARALSMLTRKGQSASLERPSSTAGSAAYERTGAATAYAVTLYQESYAAREVDGTRIQAGDSRFLVAASGLAIQPQPNDRLIVSGETWRVVRVEVARENATPVLYTVQGRR